MVINIIERLHLHRGRQNRQPASGGPGLSLDEQMAVAQRRRKLLRRAARVWNPTVRRLLAKLARARWPEQPHVGRLPLFVTRIRQSSKAGRVTWWVEHDIPPYDRFRCAAYFVDLEIGEGDACTLAVRSGQATVRLAHATAPQLEQALVDALHQPPAIIPRQMGEAWD